MYHLTYIENIKDNILMLNNEIMKIIENDLFGHQSVFIKMVYSVSKEKHKNKMKKQTL